MHKLLVFVKLHLILNLYTCECSGSPKVGFDLAYPEVRTTVFANGEELLDKSGSFIFENTFDKIQLRCTSKYPNKWSFESNPLSDDHSSFRIDKIRLADDINDDSTYTFISTLILSFKNPILSQNLSCSHPNRSKVFENCTTLVYLITSTVRTKLLVRVEPGSLLKLKGGQNPRFGGNPNCDLVLHFANVIQQYGCSYNGARFLKPTARVVSCNNFDEYSAIIKMDNCTNSVRHTCPNNFDTCKKIPAKLGAFICELDGKSVARAVYSTLEDPPTYYTRRESVNVSQVLKGRISNESNIYEGDAVLVSCYGAASYFTMGFQWAFQYENGTIEYVKPSQKDDNYSEDRQIYVSKLKFDPSRTQIKNILCFATVWNSYDYENISIPVNISVLTRQTQINTSDTIQIVLPIIIISALVIVGLVIYFKFYRKPNGLTESEIREFIDGNKKQLKDEGPIHEKAQFLPYNKHYEIAPEKLKLELNSENTLGSGQYGIVYKGKLDGPQGSEDVAVKTVRPNTDMSYLKSLLSELKIMIYLGKHDGIVNLIGAQTQELKKGLIHIVVEYCAFGDIRSYILKHKEEFVNSFQSQNHGLYQNRNPDFHLTIDDLNRWSIQIASAMDYLAGKKVIHGDLATRNVLLTDQITAKVSDFGLARQLYDYTNYVKKSQEPLPWRWMAVESLRQMSFSTQSDVWSFGVTLWEIFSLGDVPYPGLSWSLEFVDELTQGLRLLKPTYATDEMYNAMLKCWNQNPNNRPSFRNLCALLESSVLKVPDVLNIPT